MLFFLPSWPQELSPQENTYQQKIKINKESKEMKSKEKDQKLDLQGRPSKVHKTDKIDKFI